MRKYQIQVALENSLRVRRKCLVLIYRIGRIPKIGKQAHSFQREKDIL